MKQLIRALGLVILVTASVSSQTPPQTPVKIDGTGGPRTAKQTRPPDNRRPRGTAVGLLGWRAGIRSDAFGAIPFLDAAARIDAAGIAHIEAVSTNLDYTLAANEIANLKARLGDLGQRIAAYRIDAIPPDQASRATLLGFLKALEIDLVLTKQPVTLAGVNVAVEDGRGMYKQGNAILGANLRDAAKAAPMLLELSKQQPPEAPEWPNKCTDCATSRPSTKPLFFTLAPGAAENYDKAVRVAQGYRVNAISKMLPITTADRIPADEKAKIDAAIPRQALVKPKQARKLLIIDVCPAGGFYHNTVAHGNYMLQLIAKYTGAYEAIFDNNLENLRYPHIKQYDAVFLNSVVGPVFSDPEALDGLIRYVNEGGGVAGLHGTTFASQDLREFGELMGAQEGPHQYNGEPGTLKIDDPGSPLTKHFGGRGFSMMDEFYHFPMTGPYTREKLHVLLSMDADKSDLQKWLYLRTDRDFGMVWIKREGKGRVFNSVLGHRPDFYMMPDLMKMMVGGIQFVLGDLEADTTPSAKLARPRGAVNPDARDEVKTASGVVAGLGAQPSGVRMFKGVPFAEPPVGGLRWKAPQPVKRWSGVRQAEQFGPRCMQLPLFKDMNFRSNGMSEDCLYLNIWTPAKSGNERLPVLVYFFGGGFRAGDGSEPRYDGESMARRGIVALTVNYRLGEFGLFAHPELTKESAHLASGNQGFLDQVAALQWVKENIAAFGGDPSKVTIAGESAGSIAVSALMVSPLSKNLIARAIGESGAMIAPTIPPAPLADVEQMGVKFAGAVGASSLAALRDVSAQQILDAAAKQGSMRFPPAIDGYFLTAAPADVFKSGQQARVPLLAGSNSEEQGARGILGTDPPTLESFANGVRRLFGEHADAVLKVYAPSTPEEVTQAAADLAGDRFISYSTWKWMESHGRTSGKPTFYYYYTRPRPGARGASHSAEIEYAMGNLDTNTVYAWTEDDRKASRAMQGYFANFIVTGDPNGAGLPNWVAANNGSLVRTMRLDVEPQLEIEKRMSRYQVLDKIYAK